MYTRPEEFYSAVTPVPMLFLTHEKPNPQRHCTMDAQRSLEEIQHLSRPSCWPRSERCGSQVIFEAPLPSDRIDVVRTSSRVFLGPEQTLAVLWLDHLERSQ